MKKSKLFSILKLNIAVISLALVCLNGCSGKDTKKDSDAITEKTSAAETSTSEADASNEDASNEETSNAEESNAEESNEEALQEDNLQNEDSKENDSKKRDESDESGAQELTESKGGNSSSEYKGETNIQKGDAAIEAGDYTAARTLYRGALDNNEDKRKAYRGIGIASMGLMDYEAAESSLLNALKCSNGIIRKIDIDISYYLAVSQYRLGKYDEAFETYSAIIGIEKKSADAYYLRGTVSLSKGDLSMAKADYDMALSLDGNNYTLYEKIYEDLMNYGYKTEAGIYLSKAEENNSRMSDYQKGVFAYYQEDYTKARNYLEDARNKKEDDQIIKYLGKTYAALQDVSYAESLYEEYLKDNKDDGEMYNLLGMMKMKEKDYAAAASCFSNGIAVNDARYAKSLKYNEIVAYEYMLDFETAKNKMKSYLEEYPNDEKALRENEFLSSR